ncbi:MAG: hypothetical protein A2138_00380 [Deltaproteobacteria bacterium RBG_16_71_12]|nr:MAG: hypothetical protein A2138_00380 [Deltaproteobacteria bacterium RBG_16_71_12]
MQKLTLEMPIVGTCAVTDCSYNVTGTCGAHAVTIGDLSNPRCDTFLAAARHVHRPQIAAGVGACKVSECRHNRDYECTADVVRIGRVQSEATCTTFAHA